MYLDLRGTRYQGPLITPWKQWGSGSSDSQLAEMGLRRGPGTVAVSQPLYLPEPAVVYTGYYTRCNSPVYQEYS